MKHREVVLNGVNKGLRGNWTDKCRVIFWKYFLTWSLGNYENVNKEEEKCKFQDLNSKSDGSKNHCVQRCFVNAWGCNVTV